MPHLTLEYTKELYNTPCAPANTPASYALETIHAIVNEARLLHVAFVDAAASVPFPAVLPMLGQMGSFDRPSADVGDVLDLYLHGYVSARMIRVASQVPAPHNNGDAAAGLPITVSAALVDGYVLAISPFNHSYNYRSAVLFGHATVVADPAEKLYAMQLITDGTICPGRWTHTRGPPTPAEMQSTAILRVRIARGSAKIRSGAPHDTPADIATNADQNIWTGVLPTHTIFTEPVPSPYNAHPDGLPNYLLNFCRDTNTHTRDHALAAAEEPSSKSTNVQD